jgi:hypothetical protein
MEMVGRTTRHDILAVAAHYLDGVPRPVPVSEIVAGSGQADRPRTLG